MAEQAGHRHPAPLQRLLRTAVWDVEQFVADEQGLPVERLGEPQGVLIPDETGFVKKDQASVGVQRQYTGTAGRVETLPDQQADEDLSRSLTRLSHLPSHARRHRPPRLTEKLVTVPSHVSIRRTLDRPSTTDVLDLVGCRQVRDIA